MFLKHLAGRNDTVHGYYLFDAEDPETKARWDRMASRKFGKATVSWPPEEYDPLSAPPVSVPDDLREKIVSGRARQVRLLESAPASSPKAAASEGTPAAAAGPGKRNRKRSRSRHATVDPNPLPSHRAGPQWRVPIGDIDSNPTVLSVERPESPLADRGRDTEPVQSKSGMPSSTTVTAAPSGSVAAKRPLQGPKWLSTATSKPQQMPPTDRHPAVQGVEASGKLVERLESYTARQQPFQFLPLME